MQARNDVTAFAACTLCAAPPARHSWRPQRTASSTRGREPQRSGLRGDHGQPGPVLEHRDVHPGRPLRKGETMQHRDGNRSRSLTDRAPTTRTFRNRYHLGPGRRQRHRTTFHDEAPVSTCFAERVPAAPVC